MAWTSWSRGDRVARAGDLDRLPGEPLGIREDAVEHLAAGRARRATVARSGVGSRGTSSTARRAASIAPAGSPAGAPDLGQALVAAGRAERGPGARRGAPIADSRYAVARDMRPTAKAASAARTWRSTRSEAGRGPAAGRPPGRAGRRAATAPARARRARRPRRGGRPRHPAASIAARARGLRVVAPPASAAATADGGSARAAASAAWWRVRAIGSRSRSTAVPIELVAERRSRPSRSTRKPCSIASAEPAAQVGVEDAVAAPRTRRRSAGAGRSVVDLEVGRDAPRAAPASSGRPAGAISRRTRRHSRERIDQPGDDELVERAGERRRRQLAAGGEQLLGDERQAAGALGDEQQQAGRGPFALDPLDEDGELVAVERRQGQPLGRPRARRRSSRRSADPRVVAGDDVGLVGGDDAPGAGRAAIRARNVTSARVAGVGAMEVLEDEHDRPPLAEPAEHPEDALQRPGLAALRAPSGRIRRSGAGRVEPGAEVRAAGGRPPTPPGRARSASSSSASARERRADGPDERAVRLVGAGRPRRRRAGRSSARASAAHAGDRLVEEAGDPDAGRAARAASSGPGRGPRRRAPAASRAKASSRPTNRALVYLAGMAAFYGRSARQNRLGAGPGSGTPRQTRGRLGWPAMTDARRAPHPANTLNELPGEEWLYFTKSRADDGLSVRARARGAQGARRQQAAAPDGPPDRVLHAGPASSSSTRSRASAGRCSGRRSPAGRGARIGIELDPRWARVYERRRARPARRARRRWGRTSPTSGTADPGGPRGVRSVRAASCGVGDALAVLPTLAERIDRLRRDRPAVQPPAADDDGRRHAGRDARQPADRLRDGHRLTRRPRQRRRLRGVPRPDGRRSSASSRGCCARAATRSSSCATPTRTGATCSPASDLAARAAGAGLVPKGDLIWYQAGHAAAAVRLSARVRPEHRPPAHPRAAQGAGAVRRSRAARLEVGGEDVARRRRTRPSSRCRRRSASSRSGHRDRRRASASTMSPRVILWIQPCWPSGHRTSQ